MRNCWSLSLKILILLVTTLIISSHSTVIAATNVNRIGIRQVNNIGEFYDTQTNTRFIPRGNNYLILSADQAPILLDPGKYNTITTEQSLSQMQYLGYNTVRIFVSYLTVGNPTGGISQEYLSNFVDFLHRAKNHGIYVIPSFNFLPIQGGYIPNDPTPSITGFNRAYLTASWLQAKKRYLNDFLIGLRQRNAPLETILGYQLENEVSYFFQEEPFSLQSGNIQTGTGTYNISNAVDTDQMMASNLVNYTNQLTETIKALDSHALVTIGLFSPTALENSKIPHPYWLFVTPSQGGSSIDFVDLHYYPWIGTFQKQYTSFEITTFKKPIIMGEYGVISGSSTSLTAAADILKSWQIESCNYHLQGWILWGWGTQAINATGYFSAEEQNGVLAKRLAPRNNPDPCQSTATNGVNTVPNFKQGDLNADQVVNIFDYNLIITNFGTPYTIFEYNELIANINH